MKPIYLVLAFCIGLFTGYFLFNDSNSVTISPPSTALAESKAMVIHAEKSHADSNLLKRNEMLSGQLKIVSSQLKSSKTVLATERLKIDRLTQTLIYDSLPCTNRELVDSLVNRIDKLNAITDTVFSIYENKVKLKEDLVAVRDSELIVCKTAYTRMQDLVKEQALKEQQLTDDLKTILKQQKKKKFQNRLIAAGMLFISGVATTLLIRSKQ